MATKPDTEACKARTKPKAKKKTLDEILALIPDLKNVIFDPLPLPNRRKAELRIPDGVDRTNPYALFSLYWPEQLWGIISRHTNLYAAHQRTKDKSINKRPWWDISPAEIKVFVAAFIYMGVHRSPATEDYWKDRLDKDPIYTVSLHLTLNRFQ
jgi:hypothetical protein